MTKRSGVRADFERQVEVLVSLSEDAYGDTLDQLSAALDGLRREIRQRFPSHDTRHSPRSRVDWQGLWDTLRRRVSTLGMSERSAQVDEFGLDPVVLDRARWLFDGLYDRYFRLEIGGVDRLPERGPCLLVANHSGVLPYDGLMLSHAIERHHPRRERPRFLLADWLVTLPFAQPFLARVGGVRACPENARRLLDAGHFVIAFPEGVKGATKVFRERYRVKRFGRGGVVRLALETGAPLVPVGVAGAEEVHPLLFKTELLARPLGLPFLPVTPTFPWLGPLGLVPAPSKWVIHLGEPIATRHLGPDAARDELLISRINEELRQSVQQLVDRARRDRKSVFE